MRLKPEDECPQDCPGRSATCHATCEKHLAGWRARRAQGENHMQQSGITDYTVREIGKSKAGRSSSLYKFRPKERRRG